jgi:hypothetical protein
MINIYEIDLSKYKDIFGKPNRGFRKKRLFGMSLIDIITTLVFALFISTVLEYKYIHTFVICILSSIVIHKLFNVNTALITFLNI